jgi:hypothetical protein
MGFVRRLRMLAAVAFGATALFCAGVWGYDTQQDAGAFLGITSQYDGWTRSLLITGVVPGSGATRAGLQRQDRVVAIDGRPLDSPSPFFDRWSTGATWRLAGTDAERRHGPRAAAPRIAGCWAASAPVERGSGRAILVAAKGDL